MEREPIASRAIRVAIRLYRASLRLLPRPFRIRNGDEMLALFSELTLEARARDGLAGIALCLARETIDVVITAARVRLTEPAGAPEMLALAPASLGPSAHLHHGSNDMESFRQDVTYAVRAIIRRPAFTTIAVITLALGIGATTAIFSVVNSVVLRPLPYPDPDRITMVWRTMPSVNWTRAPVSYPNFRDMREAARSFESLAAYGSAQPSTIVVGTEPELHFGVAASASLFRVLGVAPMQGRHFTESEDVAGASKVVILSHALATRLFGRSSSMVGRSIPIDRVPHTVVGVMPPGFAFPSPRAEYWVPIVAASGEQLDERDTNFLTVIGRLRPGVSLAAATTEMDGINARLALAYPQDNANGTGLFLESRQQFVTGDVRPVLFVLFGAVGFVLAIACANLANLMLARGSGRRRELAVRMALGASRRRLVRQLLTESTLLGLLGGALGVALAFAGTKLLVAFGPAALPRRWEIGVDLTTLAFTAAVAVLSGLAAGLVPAFRFSRPNLQGDLKGGAQGTARSASHRLQRGLVVVQVALALVLLVGAGLLTNSLLRLMTVDPGFDPRNLLTVRVAIPEDRYTEEGQTTALYDRLIERIGGLPGVERVAAAWSVPFSSYYGSTGVSPEGQDIPVADRPQMSMLPVRGDYFRTMGMRLIEGRVITDADRADGPEVIVINEMTARRFWPNQSAVGKRVRRGSPAENRPWITVVGVVADVKEALDTVPGLQGYWPQIRSPWARDMALVIRTQGDPLALSGAVRREIRAADPEIPIVNTISMEQLMSESVSEPRFRTIAVLSFAGIACLLALVGIYGVMAFVVAERTHEIGVRMALGARQNGVLRHVLGQGFRLTVLGLSIGLVGAFGATRAIQAMLFGVGAMDPATYSIVVVALGGVAMLACWIPAWRASRVDPLVALRGD
jgi:putative ABC transport system permease protein